MTLAHRLSDLQGSDAPRVERGEGEVEPGETRGSFEEAATVFEDPLSLTIRDPDHSTQEDRFVTIGESLRMRLIVVVHTDRDDAIRIVSPRVASRHERKAYEEAE